MILLSLGHGEKLSVFDNILLGGYTDDKNQMVLVKVFGDSFDVTSKVRPKYSLDKQLFLICTEGFSTPNLFHATKAYKT